MLDARTIEGSIPVMVAETLASVRRNMRYESFVNGAGRVDVSDYPEVAVREAVANALMHRDYSPEGCSSPVQVMMYADRMEVLSPGGLYGTVTVDNIGTLGATSSRNVRLCRLLEGTPYPMGYPESGYVVENKGMGFAQIRSSLKAAGNPAPVLADDISNFVLTMHKRGIGSVSSAKRLLLDTPTREDVLRRLVRQRGSVSTSEVAAELAVSDATARRVINRLIEAGELRRVAGTGRKNARYESVE